MLCFHGIFVPSIELPTVFNRLGLVAMSTGVVLVEKGQKYASSREDRNRNQYFGRNLNFVSETR